MKNQFFYGRKEPIQPKEGNTEVKFNEYTDSFSLDSVIRSIELEDRRRLILLNDIHERLQKTPQYNSKGDKITGYTKERNTFQSEIFLSELDSKRYAEATNVMPYEFA